MSSRPNHSRATASFLECNAKIVYYGDNAYGAKIYKDMMNRYLVKVENPTSAFQETLFVNYQGNRYMAKDGTMYLVVEDPSIMDVLY